MRTKSVQRIRPGRNLCPSISQYRQLTLVGFRVSRWPVLSDLMIKNAQPTGAASDPPQLVAVLNWLEELKGLTRE